MLLELMVSLLLLELLLVLMLLALQGLQLLGRSCCCCGVLKA